MNTEKLEKLKKSLDNKFIPDNMKDKIRAEIKKLEADIKTDETITATEVRDEVKKIEKKVEKALEVAEKKEEQSEAKKDEAKKKSQSKAGDKKTKKSKTKTLKNDEKPKAVKKSVFSTAKEIRKAGESWEDAKLRARKMMKSETTEIKKKTRTETDKLLAMVRRNKEYKKLAGNSNLSKDAQRRAMPRGKRISKNGTVYYENRANRVDVGGFKTAYLETGGGVDEIIELKPLELIPLSTQLNKLSGYGWTFGDWESEDGSEPSTMPNSVIVNVHTKQKFRLSPFYIYKGYDHYNSKPLYRVEDMSEEGEYVGEWHTKREDAEQELKEMFNIYSNGFALEKPYNVIYTTKSGRTMVAKNIMALDEFDAKQKLKKQMRVSDSFDKILMAHESFSNGGTIIGTPETPLSRDLGISYTGLVGETGSMSSGEMFAHGGEVDDEKFKKFINTQINYIISLKTISQKKEPIQNLLNNMEDYRSGSEIVKRITTDNLKYALQQKTVSKMNEVLKISLNALEYSQGGSLVDGYLTDPNFGDFQAGVYEMGGNTGLPAGAEQSYVNYYLNEGATAGMYKKGGAIPNNYEGKYYGDIWDKEWTDEQKYHFLSDHKNEIGFNEEMYNESSLKRTTKKKESSKGNYTGFQLIDSEKLVKTKSSELPRYVKFAFEEHIREGQYAYGGKAKSRPSMRELHIEQIASLTGTRSVGVQKFADDNNLNDSELSNLMTGVGRGMIKRSDFVTALAGEKNNPIQKEVVAFAKSDKAYKMANGGVIGKEMTFNRHGEEEKGIIGEVNEDGSYNVATKYSSILVEPQDVIAINDAPKKKRFFFDEGGNVIDAFQMRTVRGVDAKPTEILTTDQKVEFAKGGSIKNEDIKVGEEFWLANGDVIEIVRLFKENIDEDWVEYKRNGEKKENSVKELRLFINRLSGKKQKSWRERRNEYLEKLGQKEADVWDKIGAESGSEIRNSDKMLKAYAEGVQYMLQKEEVGKGSFDQEDYDFYTDENWHLFNEFLVWNGYYDPETTKNEKAWREKKYADPKMRNYVSNPSIISLSGGSKSKSTNYVPKGKIKTIIIVKDGKEIILDSKDFLNGVNLYDGGGKLNNDNTYFAKRYVKEVITEDGDKLKPSNGYWVKKSALKSFNKKFEDGGKATFKQKATAIAKNFEGKKVEPKYQKEYGKTYDKAEAKEVGNKIAGSQKAKYNSKMSGGGKTKRGGAMVLAKQIRKEGESWQSALKRANAQVRNK